MRIVFYCSHCGARFEVAAEAAGKTGRCKRCREALVVPAASTRTQSASPQVVAEAGGPSWLQGTGSQVGLAPLTVGRIPGVRTRDRNAPPVDVDLGDSKPYSLVSTRKAPSSDRDGRASAPAGAARVAWRDVWGAAQKLFRQINEFPYLISIPFIILLLLGATMHNRSLALMAAEAVVLLNVGRVASGLANILAVPFREGPATGVLFLVPPFTIKYMFDNWKKLRRPVRRVVGPLLTIAAVILAFVLLPSLSGRGEARAAGRQQSTTLGR